MRLLRYGPRGAEKPGVLDSEGRIRDLSREIPDINAAALAPESLARLASRDPASLPLVEGDPRIGPPVANVPNLVCIGLNYVDHAKETNSPIPEIPIVFMSGYTAKRRDDPPNILVKPFQRDELLGRVKDALASAGD